MRQIAACSLALLMGAGARGDELHEILKLTASDAPPDTAIAQSVAVSDTLAVVGAEGDNKGGFQSGAAYVFDVMTGQELFKLVASDAADNDWLGNSVAVSGTVAVVGAVGDDDAGSGSGSAYVFDVTTGQEHFKLTASDAAAGDQFGDVVAMSGMRAVVGAPRNNDGFGSAYVFDVTTGQELFRLTASDANGGDVFGRSVAVSGTLAVIGAPDNDDAGNNSGSAYVFDVTTGQELFKLTASDAAAGDRFGASIAISGTRAVVGAVGNSDAGAESGSAYIFDVTTGQELFKLTASDAAFADRFGLSVAVSATLAVIGAERDDDTGSAYVFDVTTGQELFKLTASDGAANDIFGRSVATFETLAVVGAPGNDDSGSAYVFDLDPCLADLDGDGDTDPDDYFAYLDAFAAFDLGICDIDDDGDCDAEDFFAYLDRFADGC